MISFVLFPQASPPSMNFNIFYPNWSITSTKTKWKNVLPQNMCVFIVQWMSSTFKEYLQEKKTSVYNYILKQCRETGKCLRGVYR